MGSMSAEYSRNYYHATRERRRLLGAQYEQSDKGKATKTAWLHTPRGRFKQQRDNARQRGVGWQLTFEQWWELWEPHYDQRGVGSADALCMCRYGDVGPYAKDNVYIATQSKNQKDRYATSIHIENSTLGHRDSA